MQPLEKIKLACSIIRQFKEKNLIQISYPFENATLNLNDDMFLMDIYNEVTSDNYVPSSAYIIDIPKPRGLIRHFSYITVKDQLLYTLLIIDCFPAIFNKIARSSPVDSLEVLKNYPIDNTWMKKQIRGDLMEKRKPLFDKGYSSILNSDISAFGPNIDIRTLCNELQEAGAPITAVQKLEKCLRKWSPLGHKGVPQVYFATDLLAEFYLKPVDRYFATFGDSIYLRESDNLEIWCKSKSSCKEMLTNLSRILYDRGLYLNNNKTKIVNEKSVDRNEHPMEHKKYGWRNDFKQKYNNVMNLYYRFEQRFFINECSRRLKNNPEFTIALLQHYSTQRININRSLIRFLTSSDAIYSYQNYIVIKWLITNYREPDRILLQIVRQFAWNEGNPYYLRSIARYFIYKHGNDTDHDMIETRSRETTDELEIADMLYLSGLSKDFILNG